MDYFTEYRNVVAKMQELAGGITALKQNQWDELTRLNETRNDLNSAIIKAVERRNETLEEAMAVLADHIKETRKALSRAGSPDSSAEDVLFMEQIWQKSASLLHEIAGLPDTNPPAQLNCADSQISTPEDPDKSDEKVKEPEQLAIVDNMPAGTESCSPIIATEARNQAAAAVLDKYTIPTTPNRIIPSKKNKKSKNDRHPEKEISKISALSSMPARIIPYEPGDILPEEIKRNVEAIKQGKR
jgi:hypothetical protein